MAVHIELDIYSGRVNPAWTLGDGEISELRDRLVANPELQIPVGTVTSGLGYRGFVIHADGGELTDAGLYSQFRLGGQGAYSAAAASQLWLLDTARSGDDAALARAERAVRDRPAFARLRGEARAPSQPLPPPGRAEPDNAALCGQMRYTSSDDFSYWNDLFHIFQNNCYNYGSNYRSDTFAQPGRRSGAEYTSFSCAEVMAAVRRDGWSDTCPANQAPAIVIALVIAPDEDFHFYRLTDGGLWTHKPGSTPATRVDEAGNTIADPETAARGDYTEFCGYFYTDLYQPVS